MKDGGESRGLKPSMKMASMIIERREVKSSWRSLASSSDESDNESSGSMNLI